MEPETLGPPDERQDIHLECEQPHYINDLEAVAKGRLSGAALPQSANSGITETDDACSKRCQ
jgi:hypothetical protein